mgnify:CR=1 FL=1
MEIAAIAPGILSRRCLRSEQKISRIEQIKQKEQELIKKYQSIVSRGTDEKVFEKIFFQKIKYFKIVD